LSIQRVAARIILRELADVFTTPTVIVNALKARGMSYRNQNMFRDANNAIGWAKHRKALAEAVGPRIGFREAIPSYDLGDGERYKTYGVSVFRDDESGLPIRKESSFYSDVLWEKDEDMEDEFAELFAEGDERYKGQTFIGFEINGVEINADMSPQKLLK